MSDELGQFAGMGCRVNDAVWDDAVVAEFGEKIWLRVGYQAIGLSLNGQWYSCQLEDLDMSGAPAFIESVKRIVEKGEVTA